MPSYRVIQSGHIVEVYEYSSSFAMKRIEDDMPLKSREGGRDGKGKQEDRKAEYIESVNNKARNKIRRLVSSNFDDKSLFVTITFKENMTDIEKANYEFKKFLQKMKRRQKDFKHVSVIEFQKRGAIHYHMICNYRLKWITRKELQEKERDLAKIWGHGFVDITDIKGIDNIGAYLIKYMSKEQYDERLEGKKRYFFSRNMIQPKILEGDELRKVIQNHKNHIPVFSNSYYNEFTGDVKYREYNPKRNYEVVMNE